MVHVSSTMWRIKNQPSNSTSCSDNALHLLVLVTCNLYWGLQVTSSFSIWGCILKGQITFEGHWRHQSWTLGVRFTTASTGWQMLRERFNKEHDIMSVIMSKKIVHGLEEMLGFSLTSQKFVRRSNFSRPFSLVSLSQLQRLDWLIDWLLACTTLNFVFSVTNSICLAQYQL